MFKPDVPIFIPIIFNDIKVELGIKTEKNVQKLLPRKVMKRIKYRNLIKLWLFQDISIH